MEHVTPNYTSLSMLIVVLFIELRQQLGANRELINALQVANRKQYQKKTKKIEPESESRKNPENV